MPTQPGYKLVRLANGAQSVHSLEHAETMHPGLGPVAEAEALYVRQLRLAERLAQHRGEFVIWDVGLGAAANALTVLRATQPFACPLRLVSFDCTASPLRFALEQREALGYLDGWETRLQQLLETQRVEFRDERRSVAWEFHPGDFPELVASPAAQSLPKPHVVMFDAYSPAKNPAMWTRPLFTNLFRLLDPARPCVLPTYSRSTMLRVTLLLAGFFAGAGHAAGRKEETTVAANTRELLDEPLDLRWLQRARRSDSAEPLTEAVYRKAALSEATWEALRGHPQFAASVQS